MSFQIASDLHLEFYSANASTYRRLLKPSADYLLLAGDIGYPCHLTKFFEYCSPLFKKIFYISGNHEYYCSRHNAKTMNCIDKEINDICALYPNIFYLNNQVYVINEGDNVTEDTVKDTEGIDENPEEVVVVGTTLWSSIDPKNRSVINHSINDYRSIWITENHYKKCVSPEDISMLYQHNVKWLQDVLKEHHDKKIIVMTHHLPSLQLIHEQYKDSPVTDAFASDIEFLMSPNIKFWVAGHTHCSMEVTIGETSCITNPAGYPNNISFENSDYSNSFTIEL